MSDASLQLRATPADAAATQSSMAATDGGGEDALVDPLVEAVDDEELEAITRSLDARLSRSLWKWRVSGGHATEVLDELIKLPDPQINTVVGRLHAAGRTERLFNKLPKNIWKERTNDIVRVARNAPPDLLQDLAVKRLSTGWFDWAITAADADQVLVLLSALPQADRESFINKDDGRWYARLTGAVEPGANTAPEQAEDKSNKDDAPGAFKRVGAGASAGWDLLVRKRLDLGDAQTAAGGDLGGALLSNAEEDANQLTYDLDWQAGQLDVSLPKLRIESVQTADVHTGPASADGLHGTVKWATEADAQSYAALRADALQIRDIAIGTEEMGLIIQSLTLTGLDLLANRAAGPSARPTSRREALGLVASELGRKLGLALPSLSIVMNEPPEADRVGHRIASNFGAGLDIDLNVSDVQINGIETTTGESVDSLRFEDVSLALREGSVLDGHRAELAQIQAIADRFPLTPAEAERMAHLEDELVRLDPMQRELEGLLAARDQGPLNPTTQDRLVVLQQQLLQGVATLQIGTMTATGASGFDTESDTFSVSGVTAELRGGALDTDRKTRSEQLDSWIGGRVEGGGLLEARESRPMTATGSIASVDQSDMRYSPYGVDVSNIQGQGIDIARHGAGRSLVQIASASTGATSYEGDVTAGGAQAEGIDIAIGDDFSTAGRARYLGGTDINQASTGTSVTKLGMTDTTFGYTDEEGGSFGAGTFNAEGIAHASSKAKIDAAWGSDLSTTYSPEGDLDVSLGGLGFQGASTPDAGAREGVATDVRYTSMADGSTKAGVGSANAQGIYHTPSGTTADQANVMGLSYTDEAGSQSFGARALGVDGLSTQGNYAHRVRARELEGTVNEGGASGSLGSADITGVRGADGSTVRGVRLDGLSGQHQDGTTTGSLNGLALHGVNHSSGNRVEEARLVGMSGSYGGGQASGSVRSGSLRGVQGADGSTVDAIQLDRLRASHGGGTSSASLDGVAIQGVNHSSGGSVDAVQLNGVSGSYGGGQASGSARDGSVQGATFGDASVAQASFVDLAGGANTATGDVFGSLGGASAEGIQRGDVSVGRAGLRGLQGSGNYKQGTGAARLDHADAQDIDFGSGTVDHVDVQGLSGSRGEDGLIDAELREANMAGLHIAGDRRVDLDAARLADLKASGVNPTTLSGDATVGSLDLHGLRTSDATSQSSVGSASVQGLYASSDGSDAQLGAASASVSGLSHHDDALGSLAANKIDATELAAKFGDLQGSPTLTEASVGSVHVDEASGDLNLGALGGDAATTTDASTSSGALTLDPLSGTSGTVRAIVPMTVGVPVVGDVDATILVVLPIHDGIIDIDAATVLVQGGLATLATGGDASIWVANDGSLKLRIFGLFRVTLAEAGDLDGLLTKKEAGNKRGAFDLQKLIEGLANPTVDASDEESSASVDLGNTQVVLSGFQMGDGKIGNDVASLELTGGDEGANQFDLAAHLGESAVLNARDLRAREIEAGGIRSESANLGGLELRIDDPMGDQRTRFDANNLRIGRTTYKPQ